MARPRSDISERIVLAAGERFLRDGVDGASLREIARGARTSVGMITYYFPTKDALFSAVVEHAYTGLLDDIATALAPDAPYARQIERLHDRLAALSDEEFLVLRLVIRELLVASPRTPALLTRFSRGHVPLVLEAVAGAYQRGEIREGVNPVAAILATFLSGLGAQIVWRLLSSSAPLAALVPSPAALADGVRDVLFHGLAPPRRGR